MIAIPHILIPHAAIPHGMIPHLATPPAVSQYRVYLGIGGVEDIDWTTPVATVSDEDDAADVSLSLVPGVRYALAARRVSEAGVEEHNTHVVTFVEVSAAGVLSPTPLPRPSALSFERVSAEVVRLGFSCDVPAGYAEPTEYHVYGDGGTGAMDYETSVTVLAEHVAGRREFVVELPTPVLPLQLSVQARRGGQSGPAGAVLVIPDAPWPVTPVILPGQ